MNAWQYVIPGYLITGVVLISYALWVLRRGRALSRQVPVEQRRYVSE